MWWTKSWLTIEQEFSDLADVAAVTRICVRLLVALALGALLGYQRESSGANAGLRTHMLVSAGAAIFIMVPLQAGMQLSDLSRVIQGVTAGIGFLGAGAIIKLQDSNQIKGLTTAASIWLTCAIGVAAGAGLEATAVLSTITGWVVLALMRQKEK